MKCDEVAESFILKADECFSSRKYAEALENYNQCLRFAENKSQVLMDAFVGRSKVYQAVQQFDKCVDNIKEDCREKFSDISSDKSDNETWSFFKLSHPAHKKIPFIAECLEVRENDVYGRYIMTNKDLNPGDIIVVEEPFYKVLDPNQRHNRCAVCLRQNMMNLFPCEKCDGESVIDIVIKLSEVYVFISLSCHFIFSHVLLEKVQRFRYSSLRVHRAKRGKLRQTPLAANVLSGSGDHRLFGGVAETHESPDVKQNYNGFWPQRPARSNER